MNQLSVGGVYRAVTRGNGTFTLRVVSQTPFSVEGTVVGGECSYQGRRPAKPGELVLIRKALATFEAVSGSP